MYIEAVRESPMGYMTVKTVHEPDGRNLNCTRFCFTCGEGLKGLFQVLLALGSNHEYVTADASDGC